MSDSEHQPASRSVALEAVIRVAINKVGASSWRQTVESPRVIVAAEGETSERTVRRAMKDAEALGWLQKQDYGNEFEPGPRAREVAGDE